MLRFHSPFLDRLDYKNDVIFVDYYYKKENMLDHQRRYEKCHNIY
jgi:hypothetical protein